MRATVNLLGLDSSGEYCSVALLRGDALSERHFLAGQSHAERLLPAVHELLAEAGITLADLDGVAFGEGPGSFTGLRIACGVAQGLAWPRGLPVAGVSTLAAIAQACGAPRVLAAIDARMGGIYQTAFEKAEQGWRAAGPAVLCQPQDAPQPEGGGWTGCGSGFAAHGAALRERHGKRLTAIEPDHQPRAAAILALARPRFACGDLVAAAQALPVYLRDKVALTSRERAQGTASGVAAGSSAGGRVAP